MSILAMQEAVFRKLAQYSSHDEGRLAEEPKANLLLRQLCTEISDVPKEAFIAWLVTVNNKLCCCDISSDALELIHGVFAKQLWEYHKRCNPTVHFPDSQYLRDVILNNTYGLFFNVMLIKHMHSDSNLRMLKYGEYSDDSIYTQLDAANANPANADDEPVPLGGRSANYKSDPNFQKIVQFQNESNSSLFFSGIPHEKGGLLTMLEIMIDNLALIRFCGILGSGLSRREDAAYKHGPFFMCFSHFDESEVSNQPLFRVHAKDIIFILPTESDRRELLTSMNAAVELGLLDSSVSEGLVHNIMTYETYASEHCVENTAIFNSGSFLANS